MRPQPSPPARPLEEDGKLVWPQNKVLTKQFLPSPPFFGRSKSKISLFVCKKHLSNLEMRRRSDSVCSESARRQLGNNVEFHETIPGVVSKRRWEKDYQHFFINISKFLWWPKTGDLIYEGTVP